MRKSVNVLAALVLLGLSVTLRAEVTIYPDTPGLPGSSEWHLTADGQRVGLYSVDTINGNNASFGSFDFSGRVELRATSVHPVKSVKITPANAGIEGQIKDNDISFTLDTPGQYTIEINESPESVLHLFANPPETDIPDRNDPNVRWFEPGIHLVSALELTSNQTLYIAPGAILRCVIPEEEAAIPGADYYGYKGYAPVLSVGNAENVTLRGRGILDMSALPWHSRKTFYLYDSKNLVVDGLTFINSATWTICISNCNFVTVNNIKQIASEDTSSDGIDIVNSQAVTVRDSFLRNDDDGICVKTLWEAPCQISKDILVERCVIWNERARALGIISETRQDIENVTFRDCDIIRDFSNGTDCAALGILVSDKGRMKNTRFEDIRIEDSQHFLIYCWIGSDVWGNDLQRGHIQDTLFRNIRYTGKKPVRLLLKGYDSEHAIDNTRFENLQIQDTVIRSPEQVTLETNEFVRDTRFE